MPKVSSRKFVLLQSINVLFLALENPDYGRQSVCTESRHVLVLFSVFIFKRRFGGHRPKLQWWLGVVVSALASINKVNLRRAPVSTEMGDRVRVQFPVPDTYFGM